MSSCKRATGVVSLLMVLLLMVMATHAQKNAAGMSDREREHRSMALAMVRAINAAEANYKKNHGVYANWDMLLGNGDFTDAGTKWAPESFPTVARATYNRTPEIVPGWKLRLNLSKEGAAYDLLLEDASDLKCGYAVSSDERGVIRQGRAVGCEP
jgi:hypothetical protein